MLFEGLFVFLNELYIQGSTIKYTINNLKIIVNKSLQLSIIFIFFFCKYFHAILL